MDIGKRIRDRRLELNLTLEEVGNAVGVNKSTVKKWEDGYISNMHRDRIDALAKVLKISPVSLITGEISNYQKTSGELSDEYLSFAKHAQDEGINPKDIELAIQLIKKAREK